MRKATNTLSKYHPDDTESQGDGDDVGWGFNSYTILARRNFKQEI